jgi:TadE-like protein
MSSEGGAAMVELALILPLLLLMIFGMIDFGKAFNEWITQQHLASEGARLAAVNYCPSPSSDSSGNLTCDWSSIACSGDSNVCLAKYIDNQLTGELKTGRPAPAGNYIAPGQNAAKVCISYPNGAATQVGDPVHVEVQVTYHWLNYVANRLSLASTVIKGAATMRLESKPYSGSTLATWPGTCYPGSPAGS